MCWDRPSLVGGFLTYTVTFRTVWICGFAWAFLSGAARLQIVSWVCWYLGRWAVRYTKKSQVHLARTFLAICILLESIKVLKVLFLRFRGHSFQFYSANRGSAHLDALIAFSLLKRCQKKQVAVRAITLSTVPNYELYLFTLSCDCDPAVIVSVGGQLSNTIPTLIQNELVTGANIRADRYLFSESIKIS